MSTQYDNIGVSFNEMRKLPLARLSDYNVQEAVSPFIKGAKVLDLACGTGLVTNDLAAWGASSVLGIDISSVMIKAAKTDATSEKVQFEVGDCFQPRIFGGGNFDLVVGAWLLNYASNKQTMTDMYRTIAMNLKAGGSFVGVTPPPTEDPKSFIQKALQVRPVGLGQVAVLPLEDVPNGLSTHLICMLPSGTVEFDAYHLEKAVYETSAKEGGLKGELTWQPARLPPDETQDGASNQSEDLHGFIALPHFAILVISKT
ncbi:MAG: hypothetical protein Q9195_007821 [Heterodermia aff. obscurata]